MRLKMTNERAPRFEKIALSGEQIIGLDSMGRVWVHIRKNESDNTEDGWMMLGRSVFEPAPDNPDTPF